MPFFTDIFQYWRSLLIAVAAVLLVALGARMPQAMPEDDASCEDTLNLTEVTMGQPLGERLEVLSWNMQKASKDGWQADLASFGEGVHLAFLQEASLQAPIAETLTQRLHQSFAAGYTTSSKSTGVMTLSSSRPSVHCNLTTLEPWLGTPKATGVTFHPIEGRDQRLLAVNLHAVNFAMGVKEFGNQIHAIKELLGNHDGPVIIAGDLNTWSGRRQNLVDQFMDRHELQAIQFFPDLRTRIFGRALDHIYVRGLDADTAEVIPVSSSDHNALRLSLKFH